MKLTKLGKIIFTIYNIIMLIIAYIVAGKVGGLVIESNVFLVICIACWLRVFITPFYLSLIWEVNNEHIYNSGNNYIKHRSFRYICSKL